MTNAASSADLSDGRFSRVTETITVTCATDGNHGRSVAWGAARFHCRCVIFVHATVSQARVDAIATFGAQVRRVSGLYYTEVPRTVMQGYRLMADEATDQWDGPPPTHVFMQAGVGGAAAAVSVQMRERFQPSPALIVVEPERAACCC